MPKQAALLLAGQKTLSAFLAGNIIMSKIKAVKGFADFFGKESALFCYLEDTARQVFGRYGYTELRIPIVEYSELFSRSIGTETDVVQKEMFSMADRKGRSLSLRPEATAGIVRAYIEHAVHAQETVSKIFSYGPMFRYERPQKGRMRQFHQLDCECLGPDSPHLDAEVILMLMHFLREIGLDSLQLELNTLGCHACRPAYKETLLEFLRDLHPEDLCEDCRRRLQTNPMRVLDCKVPACKALTEGAPSIGEHVCQDCAGHFAVVRRILDANAVPCVLNPRLVRGLDYYTRTTFEVVSTSIGAQGSVAGGGRYDGLVAQLGGPEMPGIGFACGMERLALMLEEKSTGLGQTATDFFLVLLDEKGADTALAIAQTLRSCGLRGETSFSARSMKSQMRQASRVGAAYCLILGASEIEAASVGIKNMESGEQSLVPLADLENWAKSLAPLRSANCGCLLPATE